GRGFRGQVEALETQKPREIRGILLSGCCERAMSWAARRWGQVTVRASSYRACATRQAHQAHPRLPALPPRGPPLGQEEPGRSDGQKPSPGGQFSVGSWWPDPGGVHWVAWLTLPA